MSATSQLEISVTAESESDALGRTVGAAKTYFGEQEFFVSYILAEQLPTGFNGMSDVMLFRVQITYTTDRPDEFGAR